MAKKVYQELARLVDARLRCIERGNEEWVNRHEEKIEQIMKKYAPRGSGIDNGTKIDLDKSHGEKLIFTFSYHYMNENGFYEKWYDYNAIVKPSLRFGCEIRIIGKKIYGIKDYFYAMFDSFLDENIEYD